MLKLSRNGIGVLTSQYRSVLKKCALLNMVAAGLFLLAPQASAATGENIDSLSTMGTEIGSDKPYDTLYVNGESGNNIAELFSESDQRGWITNYGDVYIGYKPDGTYLRTVVSNKHSTPQTTSTSDVTPVQGGGVISNQNILSSEIGADTKIMVTTFENNSITEFNVTNAESHPVAAGGVISNVGINSGDSGSVATKGVTFQNNYAMQFVYADGGAVYNGLSMAHGEVAGIGHYTSSGDTFKYNHTGNEDMSQSEFDVVKNAVTAGVTANITNVWKEKWQGSATVSSEHPNGVTTMARGGAIFNVGDASVFLGKFEGNYTTGADAYGGAVFNTDRMYNEVATEYSTTDSVMALYGETTFTGNKALSQNVDNGAARGGAIANEATFIFDTDTVLFQENYAKAGTISYGGAIYNSKNVDDGDAIMRNIRKATFENNYAETTSAPQGNGSSTYAYGGAIYNDSIMVITDGTFRYNETKVVDNYLGGSSAGGAIYNQGKLGLGKDPFGDADPSDTYRAEQLVFKGNSAGGVQGKGGAINNNGEIIADVTNDIIFNGNSDHSTPSGANPENVFNGGGAIYGNVNSVATFNMSGKAKVKFEEYGMDNVYMADSAKISFIGKKDTSDNETPSMSPTSDVVGTTSVELGATFTGTGTFEVRNTQLNLVDGQSNNGTGYIDFYPKMDIHDSIINMKGTHETHMYLSSNNDVLDSNDIYINNSKATLYYADYNPQYNDFALGDYVLNNGLIVYDDMPQKGIAHTIYENESNSGDVDIKIANTLENRGVVSTAVDGYITKRVHIGELKSVNGMFYINTDNENLINTDNEHILIPEPKEGYEYGTYNGVHYASEVIVIDNDVTGNSNITLVDLQNSDYKQIQLEAGQRIYFAQTPITSNLESYTWNIVNAVNDNYEIKVGYDQHGEIYDWFLYRGAAASKDIPPEDMVGITIPRAALEQVRSFRLAIDKTNRGQCSCYQDNCNNSFCQYEQGSPKARLWATPFYRQGTFDKPFETDFKLAGIDFGMDYQPTTSDLIGIFGSYRFGKYENDGNQKHYGDNSKYYSEQGGELELKSLTAGLYYRKYINRLYLLGAVYGGKIDGDIKADNGVKGSIDGKTFGAQAEIGYDIKATKRTTVTPSLRANYDYIKFDKGHTKNDKKISVGKVNSVELEAALKLEYQFNNQHQLPTTGYIKPSIIQTIPDGGKVKIGDKEYTKNLDNETLGRIEIGADTNLTTNFSVGVFGNYTFGSDYKAWGVGGNVRVMW